MSHAHSAEHHDDASIMPYLVVFGALAVFTIVSFVVNGAVRGKALEPHSGFAIILGVAVIKALLVATIFMHLKFDWGRVYFMIIPALVLGCLMMFVFMPDILLAWKGFDGTQLSPAIPQVELPGGHGAGAEAH
jgi:cytochrome c oxidase subunit IV